MRKKLIDKDALMAEIESIEYETNYEPFTDEVLGKRKVCKDIKDFLDTLEVKEEILDESGKNDLMQKSVREAFKSGFEMGVLQTTNKMNHNTKDADLEKEIIRVSKNEYFDFTDWKSIARHFYELGLKAQNGN